MPFSPPSVTGYNANPPEDDGSQTPTNEVTWAKHKTKIGDPIKTALEALITELSRFIGANYDGEIATAAILDDAITFAKMQNIATDRLIGRDTAASGSPEEISLAAPLAFSGSGSIGVDAASESAAGKVELATAAEMATGTDTGRVPSVSVLKNHQGVAKAWGSVDISGNLVDGHNVIGASGAPSTGCTVTIAEDLANANYAVLVSLEGATGFFSVSSKAVGSFVVITQNSAAAAASRAFSFVVFGD